MNRIPWFICLWTALAFTTGSHAEASRELPEGSYAIQVECESGILQCSQNFPKDLDRLTIVEGGGAPGICVTFASAVVGGLVQTFCGAVPSPDSFSMAGPARLLIGAGIQRFLAFELTVDPTSLMIHGRLLDGLTLNYFQFSGKSLVSTLQLSQNSQKSQKTFPRSQVWGRYHGFLAGAMGTLIVRELAQGVVGSFVSDVTVQGHAALSLVFSEGSFEPKTGLLRLIFANPRFYARGELALALTLNPAGVAQAHGFEFSTFASSAAVFKKMP